MQTSEKTLLLCDEKKRRNGLSVFSAVICVIDVFGVFPLITLPKTIINCGPYGIFVVTAVAAVQIYTSALLGKCWLLARKLQPTIEQKNRYPYAALADLTYGSIVSKFVTFLLVITVFGGGIPNIIVASQNFQLIGFQLTNINFSYCYWMMAIGVILCPILWLGSPKDMKLLCVTSVAVVVVVFLLIMMCLLRFAGELPPNRNDDETLSSVLKNILTAYGVLTFQFDIHPSILTIQVDMRDGTKITRVVLAGFAVTLSMFAIIYIMVYGRNVKDSLLESLPTSMAIHFAVLLVAFQLGFSSAIGNTALYQYLEDYMGIPREFNHKRCLLRTSLVLAAILLAEIVPKFELVMALIGGTLTGPLVFVFPPLFYVKLLILDSQRRDVLHLEPLLCDPAATRDSNSNEAARNSPRRRVEILICLAIVALGTFGTVATTYVNVSNFVEYSSFSPPCVYNMTFFS